ncbi:MAG: MoxR family ATPase [Alphaproteobacteria bacterium]
MPGADMPNEVAQQRFSRIPYIHDAVVRTRSSLFGLDDVIRLSLVAYFSRGHVLLEGNPGCGKTTLIKTLCASLDFDVDSAFGRIQFTPDLMPADITGTQMPVDGLGGALEFRPGPVFCNLLLADEINRATPKTQSAMLEAMAETQVTVLGETHDLAAPRMGLGWQGKTFDAKPPFMVLATQNPIDQEGTYDLPEAQSDRFMFKIRMPDLPRNIVSKIMDKTQAIDWRRELEEQPHSPQEEDLERAEHREGEMKALYHLARVETELAKVKLNPVVETHILNMVEASNGPLALSKSSGLGKGETEQLNRFVERYIRYGLGPRAAQAFSAGVRAWAYLFTTSDGETQEAAMLKVALAVLRHRLILGFDWAELAAEEYGAALTSLPPADRSDALLSTFIALTAPNQAGYRDLMSRMDPAPLNR